VAEPEGEFMLMRAIVWRISLIWGATLVLIACPTEGGGGVSTTGTGTGSTSTAGTTSEATSGATTGGGSACSDDFDGNQSLAMAADLAIGLDSTSQQTYGDDEVLIACEGETDFFVVETECSGFLGVELIRVDSGSPDGTVDLAVYDDTTLVEEHVGTYAQFFLKPNHRRVEAGEHPVEVRHASGPDQDYQLRITFLPEGTCASAEWVCEADEGLVATETSCTAEPLTGECAGASQTTNSVALPTVNDGTNDVPGWIVHTDPDDVHNINVPSTPDLAAVTDLCETACVAEWSDNPDVAANCTAGGVFVTPRLLATPSDGAVQAIPASRQDGSGLFGTQTLNCNLHEDCCDAFDEALCAAAPERVTPARFPLGRGAEYVYEVDTSLSTLTATGNGTTDDLSLYGSVGFSECTEGHAVDPCPFYLASMELKSIDSITIPITCPWGTFNRVLYNVEVDLMQPAFGMAKGGSDEVGFPAGALIFEASMMQNTNPITVRGTNFVDVKGTVSASGISFDSIPVAGNMPGCFAGDEIPVEGAFEVVLDVSAGPEEQPPALTITTPSSVSCPSTLNLTASTSDADGDFDEVRWYVDGVLLSSSTTSFTMTGPHTLKAVAYDDRRAATTATKTIDCN
jgi:hypothetical protein